MRLPISLLTIVPLLCATPAVSQAAKTDLNYSHPKADGIEREEVQFVQIGFEDTVDLVSVKIVHPDATETEIYNAATAFFKKRSEMFAFTLSESLTAPGRYRVSYTVAAIGAASTAAPKSGSFSFTLDLPAPKSAH